MTDKENTRKIIQFLAGGYLVYLACQLYKDVFTEIQDHTFRVIFFLFATLFAAVGALLMILVLRAEIKKIRGKDQEDASALDEHIESDTETTDNEE